jgi:hypothetical protein
MKKNIYAVLLITLFNFSYSQGFQWAKKIGGTGEDRAKFIVTDRLGYIYTLGTFKETADLDPGSNTSNHISRGEADVFVMKQSYNGDLMWVTTVGGSKEDFASSLSVDNDGNVYIAGEFQDTVDFAAGVAQAQMIASGIDIFILKLNGLGDFVWVKKLSGPESEYIHCIKHDDVGNFYITGYFEDIVDFDPTTAVFSLTAVSQDVFVAKYTSSGNLIWAKKMGGPSVDVGFSLAVDAVGNVITTGSFELTADFNPGSSTHNLVSNAYTDIFISKLNSSGDFIWAKSIGGGYADRGSAVALDKQNNIYLTGAFSDTVDFNPGAGVFNLNGNTGVMDDIFILMLDSSGNFKWANNIGGALDDCSFAIELDEDKNIYIAGTFKDTLDFDPGPLTFTLAAPNEYAYVFASKHDSIGQFKWAVAIGGEGIDDCRSLALDRNRNIYLAGSFAGPTPSMAIIADFDPSSSSYTLESSGNTDAFVCRLNPCMSDPMNVAASSESVCVGDIVTYTATGSNSCTWQHGPTTAIITVTPSVTTTYYVSGPDDSGCINYASTTAFVEPCSGLMEHSKLNVRVYPNPTNGRLYFESNKDIHGIEIFDLFGNLLFISNTSNLDIDNLAPGIYFIQVNTERGMSTKKIIKN